MWTFCVCFRCSPRCTAVHRCGANKYQSGVFTGAYIHVMHRDTDVWGFPELRAPGGELLRLPHVRCDSVEAIPREDAARKSTNNQCDRCITGITRHTRIYSRIQGLSGPIPPLKKKGGNHHSPKIASRHAAAARTCTTINICWVQT